MIEVLLERLKAEAAAEAEHKAWCDEQLKENKLRREKKTAVVEKLMAEITELGSQIETMGAKIETLVKEQADLTRAMEEATKQRTKEKAENMEAIADAQAGTVAVKQALVVLREFYSSQASLMQQQPGKYENQAADYEIPEMAEYKGMQGRKGGVIGMLEVIQTDFMRLEAETKAAEAQAQREYDQFMNDSEAAKLAKHNEEVKLRLEKDQAEFEKGQKEKDLEWQQEQLAQANKYFEYLKPNCVTIHVSYEERVARREEEIAALKEAYAILDSKSKE